MVEKLGPLKDHVRVPTTKVEGLKKEAKDHREVRERLLNEDATFTRASYEAKTVVVAKAEEEKQKEMEKAIAKAGEDYKASAEYIQELR